VLTEDNLSYVFNVPVQIITHPETGAPIVLPDGHNVLEKNILQERNYVN